MITMDVQNEIVDSISMKMSEIQMLDDVLLIMVTICFIGIAALILLRRK